MSLSSSDSRSTTSSSSSATWEKVGEEEYEDDDDDEYNELLNVQDDEEEEEEDDSPLLFQDDDIINNHQKKTKPDIPDYDITHLVECIVKAADQRKANDIRAVFVEHVTTMASVLVFCNGNSRPQNAAIAASIQQDVQTQFQLPLVGNGVPEGTPESGWMVLDFGSVMVHVMTPKSRLYYNIEGQWKEKGGRVMDMEHVLVPNTQVQVQDILNAPGVYNNKNSNNSNNNNGAVQSQQRPEQQQQWQTSVTPSVPDDEEEDEDEEEYDEGENDIVVVTAKQEEEREEDDPFWS
jgi:ribosome-associated protein